MKRIYAIILIFIISLLLWFFGQKLPDIYTDLGQNAYEKGDYQNAYVNLKTALNLNRKNRNARYYYVQTLLKFSPTLAVQEELYNISQVDLNDSANLIANKKIARWRESIMSSIGPNYVERVPYDGKILRWDIKKFPLKVFIQNNSTVAPSYYQEQIKRAFMQWQASTSNFVAFKFVDNEKDADILAKVISSADMKKCTGEDCKYSVAYTSPIFSGDLLKNMQILFYDSNNFGKPFSQQEIFSTALHEIGHSLGIMGHSQTPGDLMYMESGSENVNGFSFSDFRVMTPEDINTLTLLYKLVPDITNTPMGQFDKRGQFFASIVLGDEEQISSAKIIEAQNYIKSAPGVPNGYMDLAMAYCDVKKYSLAVEQFEKALALCTNDEEKFTVYYNFAAMYMNIKDWKNALEYAKLAKSISSKDDIDGLMGYIYYNLGNKDLAKSSYAEAIQKDPTNIADSVNLSLIYFKELNFAMAGKILNSLVAANPDAKADARVKAFSLLMMFFK